MSHIIYQIKHFILVLTLSLFVVPVFANPVAGKIIPGKSIGKLELGMSSLQAKKMLGLPVFSEKSSQGFEVNIWIYTDGQMNETGDNPIEMYYITGQAVSIYFESNKAIYIETSSSSPIAPNGIATENSRLISAKKYHQNMRSTAFKVYTTKSKNAATDASYVNAYYYDDVQAGITFVVTPSNYFNYWHPIDFIGIHSKGTPAPTPLFSEPANPEYEKAYIGPPHDANFNPSSIIPGKSIGLIELGMTPKQISDTVLGVPTDQGVTPQGYDVKFWTAPADAGSGMDGTTVYFKNGVAFYIETNTTEYPTPQGVSVGGTLGQALQKYPGTEIKAYQSNTGSLYTYDNLSAGITFGVWPSSYYNHSERLSLIGIHPKGQKAPIPINYTPTTPIYNKPPVPKSIPTGPGSPFSKDGLPLTEHVTPGGDRGYSTKPIIMPNLVGFSGVVLTSVNGKRITPKVLLTFTSYSQTPRWLGETRVTFSFAGRRLQLQGIKSTNQTESGLIVEELDVKVPIKDFLGMTKENNLHFEIGGNRFVIEKKYLAGLRALRAKAMR